MLKSHHIHIWEKDEGGGGCRSWGIYWLFIVIWEDYEVNNLKMMPFSFLIIVHIIFLPRLIFGFCLLDVGPDSSPLFSETINLHL